jgi:tyrosine phenol-lyase
MDVIAESTARVYERRHKINGLKMIYEHKYLRFFQARFEQLSK